MEIKDNVLISIDNADIMNGTFTVPENMTEIAEDCFQFVNSLKSLNLSDIRVVESFICWRCKNLIEVIAPNLEEVGYDAFGHCYNLVKFKAKKIKYIEDYAFRGCKSLKNFNISKVKGVEKHAFDNCISLPRPNSKIIEEIYNDTLDMLKSDSGDIGLCYCLENAVCKNIEKYKQPICKQICFPLFTYENAVKYFNATGKGKENDYWWPKEDINIRKEFLRWCYENKSK